MIANAKIIDESQIDESKVSVGSIVVIDNITRGREFTYHIVGSYEADPVNGKISDDSPIGHSLLGAGEGDEVVIPGVREQVVIVKSVTRAKDQQ
jgi:transcription elongation factor GreA